MRPQSCGTSPVPTSSRTGGELSEEWTALDVPQGGIVMGLAARAMASAIGAPEMKIGDHWADWVLARSRAHGAGDGYASTQVELWDTDSGTLSAYATQMMIFTFPDGPPPPELRVPRELR